MSVKVDLAGLANALAGYSFAYLLTVGDDFRPHAVAVDPVLRDGVLEVGRIGATTSANAAAHPAVTLVWPPSEAGGYSLIVDGRGLLPEGGATLTVTPTRAVLHRPAEPSADKHLHDCVPLKQA